MKLLRAVLVAALLVFPYVVHAAEPLAGGAVALPAPQLEGKVSVERALKERRSVRSFTNAPLSLAEVAQLCWAAQGVTGDQGHRTAPSARGAYPLETYVLAGAVTGLPSGLYHYEPNEHSLKQVSAGDLRAAFVEKGVGQAWTATAPAIFVVAGVPSKMAGWKERAAPFMWAEAGLAAQGFFLEATALGLGSTFVGGIRPAEARLALGLPESQEVMAVFPVGHKP